MKYDLARRRRWGGNEWFMAAQKQVFGVSTQLRMRAGGDFGARPRRRPSRKKRIDGRRKALGGCRRAGVLKKVRRGNATHLLCPGN